MGGPANGSFEKPDLSLKARAGVATLTFLSVRPRALRWNVRLEATLESYGCWCPFGVLTVVKRPPRQDTNVRTGTLWCLPNRSFTFYPSQL